MCLSGFRAIAVLAVMSPGRSLSPFVSRLVVRVELVAGAFFGFVLPLAGHPSDVSSQLDLLGRISTRFVSKACRVHIGLFSQPTIR